jgi:hypothetical protein
MRPDAASTFFIPKLLGPGSDARPYGCPWDADWDQWRNQALPPWLLSTGEDEDEAETEAA